MVTIACGQKEVRLIGRGTRVDWKYDVRGDVATFVDAFECAVERLESGLPLLDFYDYTSASGPNKEQAEAIGDAIGAVLILTELQRDFPGLSDNQLPRSYSSGHRFDDWVVEAFCPSWRRARKWLRQHGVVSMRDWPQLSRLSF